jgi:hypothetical protein
MITAIIPHFYKERIPNLQPIVTSLNEQKVDQIIIWNNDEALPEELHNWLEIVGGCNIIQSERNLGCQGRFAAVPYVRPGTTHILSHDNDLITRGNALARLVEEAKLFPTDMITAMGEHRMWDREYVYISRAKFELMPLSLMKECLEHWKCTKESEHDDFWLSTRVLHRGHKIRRVSVSWRNLRDVRDDIGFWKSMPRPQWEATRNHVFLEMMRNK